MVDPTLDFEPDTYLWYLQWFAKHYGRPLNLTREQWSIWCNQPSTAPSTVSDIEWDTAKDREGDAQ